MCRIVARKGLASFVSLSALVSEIFKETGWGAFLPPNGRGLSVPDFKKNSEISNFSLQTTLFRGKEQMLPSSGT